MEPLRDDAIAIASIVSHLAAEIITTLVISKKILKDSQTFDLLTATLYFCCDNYLS